MRRIDAVMHTEAPALEADAATVRQAAEAVLDAWWMPTSPWTPLDDALAQLGGMLLDDALAQLGGRLLTDSEIRRDAVALLRTRADQATLDATDRLTIMALLCRAHANEAREQPTGGNHADIQR
jgi:hypothetical protein